MRYVIAKVLEAWVVLISIVVLGMTIPMSISIFISIMNDMPISWCIQTVPFWLFSVIGMFVSCWYIGKIYEDKANLSK